MNVLIAEDSKVSRRVLEATLAKWGYEVVSTEDGDAAWEVLCGEDPPRMLVLDWMMPGLDGTEICARVREREDGATFYILLLTAKAQKEDIVTGLQSGADDYITKPFHHEELRARIQTGRRILELQGALAERISDLERALREVRELSGLLPICAYCKKIRDDGDYWRSVEEYVASHSRAEFSHGICPECYENVVKPQLEEIE
jgi:sigma-B regulation protein RsbU (phosphoserine phosphatase)